MPLHASASLMWQRRSLSSSRLSASMKAMPETVKVFSTASRMKRSKPSSSSRGYRSEGHSHGRDRDRDSYRRAPVSKDPFFDKPSESGAAKSEPASWEAAAKTQPARGGVSANIKSKRKVAALFCAA